MLLDLDGCFDIVWLSSRPDGPRIRIQGLDPIRACQCQAEDRLRTLYAHAGKRIP